MPRPRGYKHNAVSKEKCAEAKRRWWAGKTTAQRRQILAPAIAASHTPEAIEKLSQTRKSRPLSDAQWKQLKHLHKISGPPRRGPNYDPEYSTRRQYHQRVIAEWGRPNWCWFCETRDPSVGYSWASVDHSVPADHRDGRGVFDNVIRACDECHTEWDRKRGIKNNLARMARGRARLQLALPA